MDSGSLFHSTLKHELLGQRSGWAAGLTIQAVYSFVLIKVTEETTEIVCMHKWRWGTQLIEGIVVQAVILVVEGC